MTSEPASPGGPIGVVVLGAGEGQRMKGLDKVFASVHGHPLIVHSLRPFTTISNVQQIVLILPEHRLEEGRALMAQYGWEKTVRVSQGGPRRQDSVRAGLEHLTPCTWVTVHDGARPLIDIETLNRGLEAAQETGAAVAAVPVKDTVKVVSKSGLVSETPPRETLWQVQTPQIFRYELIMEAHRRSKGTFTDDGAMVESLGHPVKVFMGSYRNIKVTTPEDLLLVKALMDGAEAGSILP